jgi:uncharacterized YccA/Bax inhibitor family protein
MDTSVRRAFDRIETVYRTPGSVGTSGTSYFQGPSPYPGTTVGGGQGGGSGVRGYGGGGGGGYGWGPLGPASAVRPFSAAKAYDKLILLCILGAVSAALGYVVVPAGLAFACMAAAFVIVLVSWFRMQWARVFAPVYSVLEGVALGSISAAFASFGHGVVPTAIAFTAATFLGALFLYRTGLVRVTRRMMSLAFMGALGLVVVGLLSLIGLSLPGTASLSTVGLVFGVVALAIAVLNLFTDFAYVDRAEAAGLPADAEWAAAFAMMTALVLVYISILRIAAVAYGGGRRN